MNNQLNQSAVDMIYLDFKMVDHGMIYYRLRNHGIARKMGEWLDDFRKDKRTK